MKNVLFVVSEWGYWGEELIGPLDVMLEEGYEYTFVTPRGRKPPALPPSILPLPNGRSATQFQRN